MRGLNTICSILFELFCYVRYIIQNNSRSTFGRKQIKNSEERKKIKKNVVNDWFVFSTISIRFPGLAEERTVWYL